MRGTLWDKELARQVSRFIPAHAGNTLMRIHSPVTRPVHPRTCGEHDEIITHLMDIHRFIPAHAGNTRRWAGWCISSAVHPRTCGEHQIKVEQLVSQRRFIPAHAGNTARAASPPSHRPVHPRTCGEHSIRSEYSMRFSGSSPHMRGTPPGGPRHRAAERFIPAHAGNTTTPTWSIFMTTVHPRTCGEHSVSVTPLN